MSLKPVFKIALVTSAVALSSFLFACGKAPGPAHQIAQSDEMTGLIFDGRNADQEADEMRAMREEQAAAPKIGLDVAGSCKYVSGISTRPPQREVAITLDDGPSPGQTPWILDVLRKHGVKATFFLIGQKAAARPDLVRMIEADGHIIGDHSWTHPNFHDISTARQSLEFTKTEQLLAPYMHGPKFFRYPYGNSTCSTNELAHSQGFRIVGWHMDSCDWAFNRTGSVGFKDAHLCEVAPQNMSNFVGHVISATNARGGGILLMHEIQPNTIRKLDEILSAYEREGYHFINMDNPALEPDLR